MLTSVSARWHLLSNVPAYPDIRQQGSCFIGRFCKASAGSTELPTRCVFRYDSSELTSRRTQIRCLGNQKHGPSDIR
jgi:hypothetical protein